MGSKIGILHINKSRRIFVASGSNLGACPTMNISSGNTLKVRDDYIRGFKVDKKIFKAVFH
jgi:hypothetical protein